jgi:C1A family cysteine protease
MIKRIYNLKINRLPPSKLNLKRLPITPNLPLKVDLSYKMPPIFDQGNLGSCTAQALSALVTFLKPKFTGSRLFLYYCERGYEESIPTDSGASLEDGIKSLIKFGICPESDWPYIIPKFNIKPPQICYINALKEQALQVENINSSSVQAMKNCLNQGFPFVIGFLVFPSFESAIVAKTGMVPYPNANEKPLGGHAILVVGFDDSKACFYCRNSWGSNWGIKGYFFIPYNYFSNPKYASDAWTIKLME